MIFCVLVVGEYFQRKIHELKERFKFGTWENAMESTIIFLRL